MRALAQGLSHFSSRYEPNKEKLREEEFVLICSLRNLSITKGKTWQQEHKTAAYVSAVRTKGEMNADAGLPFSLIQSGPPPPSGRMLPTFTAGLPASTDSV